MFWPELQPEITVLDTIANKRYQIPGASGGTPAAGPEIPKAQEPIQAVPTGDRTTIFSGMALGLGGATLLAGGILWWRRR